jgi:hypothetical protein
MLAPDSEIEDIGNFCLDTKAAHPVVDLIGGRMYIPREVKYGTTMDKLIEFTGG